VAHAAWLGQPRQLLVILSLLFSKEDVADAWFLVTVLLFAVISSGALDALRTGIGPVTVVMLGFLSARWQALPCRRPAKIMLLRHAQVEAPAPVQCASLSSVLGVSCFYSGWLFDLGGYAIRFREASCVVAGDRPSSSRGC
jgi:hypothetical protein